MFCDKCGNKLLINSNFCSNCRNKILNKNNLIISRPGTIMGFAVALNVKVDDKIYELRAGDQISINLSVGVHTISYKFWCRREKELTINVNKDKNYSLIFDYDVLWGGFKISKNSILD